MDRRTLIKSIGLTTLFSGGLSSALSASDDGIKKRVLRIAHITDVHAQPAAGAPRGFERCLHHIQNQKIPVDIIFNGGDAIMDALHQKKSNVSRQWKVWQEVLKSECSLPIESCIGNHDIWAKGPEDDLKYGKLWAKEMLGITDSYRSFDKGGWHFIILDSVRKRHNNTWYTGRLSHKQYKWLKADLKKLDKNTPVMVMSHIPIMAACVLVDSKIENGAWEIPGEWMHTDAKKIIKLFNKHKNVKLCISGHIHLFDNVIYNNVSYFCNGAVSGAWWSGKHHQTTAGYALIDLYDDATFSNQYISYS